MTNWWQIRLLMILSLFCHCVVINTFMLSPSVVQLSSRNFSKKWINQEKWSFSNYLFLLFEISITIFYISKDLQFSPIVVLKQLRKLMVMKNFFLISYQKWNSCEKHNYKDPISWENFFNKQKKHKEIEHTNYVYINY